jgi:hypothetical protein
MHAIAIGKRLLGKVDKVPGRYHVATLCFHFCYLPLVPLGTYLILTEAMSGMTNQFDGIRLPFSLKSWLVAWWRTLVGAPFGLMCFMAVARLIPDDHPPGPNESPMAQAVFFAILAFLAALLFVPYRIPGVGRATRARAAQLDAFAAGAPISATVRAVHL